MEAQRNDPGDALFEFVGVQLWCGRWWCCWLCVGTIFVRWRIFSCSTPSIGIASGLFPAGAFQIYISPSTFSYICLLTVGYIGLDMITRAGVLIHIIYIICTTDLCIQEPFYTVNIDRNNELDKNVRRRLGSILTQFTINSLDDSLAFE